MKSGKQRRGEIKLARKNRDAKKAAAVKTAVRRLRPEFGPPVNEELLTPYNSYGAPDFVRRGFYVDRPFRCVDCGKDE